MYKINSILYLSTYYIHMKQHSFFRKTLFTIILLFLFGILIEICIQLFVFVQPIPIFFSNNYTQYKSAPHSSFFGFSINSDGYKDVEFVPKQKDTYRIAAIGDSFTFAVVPYEDAYITLSEDLLKTQWQHQPVEIYNMGIPNTSPQEYLEILVTEALPLEPDMVLLNFFIGNDLTEFYYSQRRNFLKKYFKTGEILYFSYKIWAGLGKDFNLSSSSDRRDYCDTCATMEEKTFIKIQTERASIYLKDHPDMDLKFQDTQTNLIRIMEVCKKKNIRLVVAILPDESQLNAGLQQQLAKNLAVQNPGYEIDWLQPNHMLHHFLQSQGIPFIDLYDELASHRTETLYKPLDTHWNIYGNKIAGNFLAKELQAYLP